MIFVDRKGKAWRGELVKCHGCHAECLKYETISKTDEDFDSDGKRRYFYAHEVEVGLYAGMHICTHCGSKWGKAKSEK
jgi:hypothetical protein|tara:strand:+ start:1063 stop:1296 length:234 start_codon:yes stop_codon:yes gene_type:complete